MVRNDYKCGNCGSVDEFYGVPDRACYCGSNAWNIVFRHTPQIRTRHASVLEDIDAYTRRAEALSVEEAMEPGSEAYEELRPFVEANT